MDLGLAYRTKLASQPRTKLSGVVIARNEERYIGQCLDALMRALKDHRDTPVLLVDSSSMDRTVEIASRFPIEVLRYAGPTFSAVAGRRVGFEHTESRYVLFLDGDCCIQPAWIDLALERIEHDPLAAVIHGTRQEVFEDGTQDCAGTATKHREPTPGGNALYRVSVLRASGGFNPYLIAGEEAELLGRIIALGYHDLVTPEVMFNHHTLPKSSVLGFTTRLHRGLARGLGQTLRLALTQGLFLYHARRLNRYLLTLAYSFLGLATVTAALSWRNPTPLEAWAIIGAGAFLLLCWRQGSLRSATFIVADWVCVAVYLPLDFLQAPRSPEQFAPGIHRLNSARASRDRKTPS